MILLYSEIIDFARKIVRQIVAFFDMVDTFGDGLDLFQF